MLEFLSIGFWIFVSIVFLVSLFVIEGEDETRLGSVSTVIIIAFGILYYFNRKEVNGFFLDANYGIALLYTTAYLLLGVLWSFFKWLKYVRQQAKKFNENAAFYKKSDETIEQWKKDRIGQYMPVASKNKARLSAWILYWPVSGVHYVVGSLLTDLLNSIVKTFSGWYNKISKAHFE